MVKEVWWIRIYFKYDYTCENSQKYSLEYSSKYISNDVCKIEIIVADTKASNQWT